MVYIPERLRQLVIERAYGYCEYCLSARRIVIDMQIDHILPTIRGGKTEEDNLALTCARCNRFKGQFVTGVDPLTGKEVELFNPRIHRWLAHFRWDNEQIRVIGNSIIGRATIDRLSMNRREALAAREIWVAAGWHPPSDFS